MTSGKFKLRGVENPRKDACVRFLLVLILLGVTVVAVLVGCYAFNSDSKEGCNKQPELDPYGLSNWTRGGQTVAFGCFPGHQIEGHEEVILSQCIDNTWVPPPPACAVLPILLKCDVNQNGLNGIISMWQESNSTPTFVHGILTAASMTPGQVAQQETIELSRTKCTFSSDLKDVSFTEPTSLDRNQIAVHFSSSKLLGYKKALLRVTLVSIDPLNDIRATIVSIHQGMETLVKNTPIPDSITIPQDFGNDMQDNQGQGETTDFKDLFNESTNSSPEPDEASEMSEENDSTPTLELNDAPSEPIVKPLGV